MTRNADNIRDGEKHKNALFYYFEQFEINFYRTVFVIFIILKTLWGPKKYLTL